jgi:CheY-like chemotaxis protein
LSINRKGSLAGNEIGVEPMDQNPVILYVEDNIESQKVMKILLESVMGITDSTFFVDSYNFLERVVAQQPKPDVFLLDIHVKPYTGFEMLKMLREHPSFADTPVVALTASVMNEEVAQLRTAGFNGVIAKPIDLDSFPQLLARILHGESVWQIVNY